MCQLVANKQKKKYEKLPAKKAEEVIWSRANVDLWGSATMNNKNDSKMKMHLMTMVDPVSCWFEVALTIGNSNSYECNHIFDET